MGEFWRRAKEGEGVDSIDQLARLTGTPKTAVRETLIISPNSPKHLTVRRGKWLYIPARDEGGFQGKRPGDHLFSGAAALPFTGRVNSDVTEGRIRPHAPPAQLYDLEQDPQQTTNLFTRKPDVVKQLDAVLQRYRKEIPSSGRLGWINLGQ